MAQIVHGECADGGVGGGACSPESETQAFPTLRAWPPGRRVPAVNYSNIHLPVDSSDNVLHPRSQAPDHDCRGEAFAAGWDRTVWPRTRLLPTPPSHLPGRLSRLSAMQWHAPLPFPTWPSRCPPCLPTMPIPLPRCAPIEMFVLAMTFVLIPSYGIRVLTAHSLIVLLLPPVYSYKLHLLLRSTILIVQSGYRYLNRKIVTAVSLLGLLLLALGFVGIHRAASDNSLAMTRDSEIKMLNNHKDSHDRVLLSFTHDTHGNVGKDDGILNTDLRLTAGNADGSGQHQKALPHWTTNQNSNKSAQDYEEKSEMQNGLGKPHLSVHKIIDIVVVSSIVVALALLVFLLCRNCVKRAQQQGPLVQHELSWLTGSKAFQYDELVAATNNFAEEKKLGQGGFGSVYRGFLRDPDRHVAIKLLSESSGQGQREFDAEVEVLTQVRHKNIVQLVGWCHSNKGLLLVYELMAEGSLDKHLHNPVRVLSWQQRYKIILDLGSALLYLHHCCEKCIVHGDIKPENVMLDASFNAKLADFGTARLVEHEADPRRTENIAGTFGYIDPEFVTNHLRCPEADIYSFGVALLEIASGKRPPSRQPSEGSPLLVWVRNLYDRHMILDAADGKMNGNFDQQQMEHVLVTGLWCAHQDPSQRPSIEQAMDVLRCVDATLPMLSATRDLQQVRLLEELAYAHPAAEGASVEVAAASTCYLTSKDSAYLLAEE